MWARALIGRVRTVRTPCGRETASLFLTTVFSVGLETAWLKESRISVGAITWVGTHSLYELMHVTQPH